MNKLDGKVAVVTGVDRMVEEISSRGDKAIAVQGDVSAQAYIERLFSEVKNVFGRVDILVNNAGVYEVSSPGVLAKELGPRSIRANSINPGMIETEGVHAAGFAGSDFQKMVETHAPLVRVGQPDDISPTAVYLASSDSRCVTGETLLVARGLR